MRDHCFKCHWPRVNCYCALLRPFESDPRFVILVHPRELYNPVGTGRMTHRSLTNSLLLDASDFTHDPRVKALIEDPAHHAVVLYPGPRALDLSTCAPEEARAFTPPGKKLVIFVIDGTWGLARGMINRSANLRALPQLRFTPEAPSGYGFRRQPQSFCLSTLESVHWMIERFVTLGLSGPPAGGAHHAMLEVFGAMVKRQMRFGEAGRTRTEGVRASAPLSAPSASGA